MFYCCTRDEPVPVGRTTAGQFSSGDARAYFEATASDLRTVELPGGNCSEGCAHGHAHDGPATRSVAGLDSVESGPVLTPLWDKARQTGDNGYVVTVEVPLRLGGNALEAWSTEYRDSLMIWCRSEATSVLVLQKHAGTDSIRYFVATFIPDSACYAARRKLADPYCYYKDPKFEGYTILSDVAGRYTEAYLHHRGHKVKVRLNAPGTVRDTTQIIGGLSLSRTTPAQMLRSVDSEVYYSYYCDKCDQTYIGWAGCPVHPVEITGPPNCPRCNKPYSACICCRNCCRYPCICPGGGSTGGGGGGGGGEGTGGSGGSLPNPTLPQIDTAFRNVIKEADGVLEKVSPDFFQTVRDLKTKGRVRLIRSDIDRIADTKLLLYPDRTIGRYDMRFKKGDFDLLKGVAKCLVILHEYYHVFRFIHDGLSPSMTNDDYNNSQHATMVNDPMWRQWLEELFPRLSDEEIDMLIYAGTEGSPVFERLDEDVKKKITDFFESLELPF